MPGAHLALPALAAPAAVPTPAPVLQPQPRPPSFAHRPLAVRTTLPFLSNATPSADAHAALSHYSIAASVGAPCAPGWSRCPAVSTPASEDAPFPTGALTVDDGTAPWGDGFETLAPGAGDIDATVSATWTLPDSGFARVSVQYFDSVDVPVLWTAA